MISAASIFYMSHSSRPSVRPSARRPERSSGSYLRGRGEDDGFDIDSGLEGVDWGSLDIFNRHRSPSDPPGQTTLPSSLQPSTSRLPIPQSSSPGPSVPRQSGSGPSALLKRKPSGSGVDASPPKRLRPAPRGERSLSRSIPLPIATPRNRPPPVDTSQAWIIQFAHGTQRITSRMTDREMWRRVNSIDKSVYPFDALTVRWSAQGRGNEIVLCFKASDTDTAILAHSDAIKKGLAHGVPLSNITLARNFRHSKVVITGVPTHVHQHPPAGTRQPVDLPTLIREVHKESLYADLDVVQGPRWVTRDHEQKRVGNVYILIADPGDYYAQTLEKKTINLFGSRCFVRIWRDRVHVSQCPICWRLGTVHTSCVARCKFCGSQDHQSEGHIQDCAPCCASGNTDPYRCSHLSCPCCKEPHSAEEIVCGDRVAAAKAIREAQASRLRRVGGPN